MKIKEYLKIIYNMMIIKLGVRVQKPHTSEKQSLSIMNK